VLLGISVPVVSAAPGENSVPADNPDLTKACGLDVLMILDESGSIASSDATDDVRNAFQAFVDSLNNTGSSMSVIEFSTVARLPSIGGVAPGEYITIDDATSEDFEDYIDSQYNPNDRTNWEDALRVARYFAPRPDPTIPHLVVFITDGDPTQVINTREVTSVEYETKVPLSNNETSSASGDSGGNPAIPNANALKSVGSHILAIGVGSALQNNSSVNRLKKVSGDDIFDGTGTFDISTTDIYLEEDFSKLEDALRDAAFQLCAPSVTVHKLYDPTPDPDSLDDAVAGVGWEMEGTVESVPAPGSFDWVLPFASAGAANAPDTVSTFTDGAGFATFQWTPTNPDGDSVFSLTEDLPFNPPDPPGGGYTNVSSETECTYRTPDTGDTDLPLDDLDSAGGFTITIPPESIVTCTLVNLADAAPGIDIEKATNGADADAAPGPIVAINDDVTWTYVITNTGNTTLEDLVVEDDVLGTIDCPATIPIGESVDCTVTGTAEAGQYENNAEATATDTQGNSVSDSDPSHYFGAVTGIAIEKATNGDDADEPFGPGIAVGDPVDWTYEVFLPTGVNVPVDNVVVVDDAGTPGAPGDDFNPTFDGGDDGDGVLELGEVWLYSASGTATAGQYENFGTVTGDPTDGGDEVVDNDPSHYYGVVSAISIEKYTNGNDADLITDPDVPVLKTGSTVLWTYVVTNEGNAPIASWTVSDDIEGPTACTRPVLVPGASATCFLSGTVVEGSYANVGTVDATDVLGNSVSDSDPSHYIGVTPSLTIEKSTNGEDADDPTGPFISVGGGVTWHYVVTNTGSADLTDLVVIDFRFGPSFGVVTCDDADLAAGASTNCQATGTAISGQFLNYAVAIARDPFGGFVGDFDPSHYYGAESGITVEKYTNGVDADEAPGVLIPEGGDVEWSYVVTNTGNTTVDEIELTDDQLGSVTCPETVLGSGESMTCLAEGTAVRGQYANDATVTGLDPLDMELSDSDPSHYLGYLLDIDVEKSTNGEDADDPTGPYIPVGDEVTWTYVVTNPGDFYFRDVTVTDDQGVTPVFQGGDTDGDDRLDVDETWTYVATAVAEPGQYENTATVEGTVGDEFDEVLTDSDPSHYFGLDAAIDIEKGPDAAVVEIGDSHTFEITVTNTSNVPLTDVVVTDPVTPSCDLEVGAMDPDESVTYSCEVDEVTDVIHNTAFVEGLGPDGIVVDDDDDASVTVIGSGGSSAIGDLVWRDSNRNGIQDNGEQGIPGARVTLTLDTDSVTVIPLAEISVEAVTDSDGRYLVEGLVPGDYTATLDTDSVSGVLTTPGSYSITLGLEEVFLDADFGLSDDVLPFTGARGIMGAALAGLLLLALGRSILMRRRNLGST
jgi:uncharacterized repeat protein (TIGR01451 family)